MIQGSNHPRTARSARGQDSGGRIPFSSPIFFPVPADRAGPLVGRGASGSDGALASCVGLAVG